MASRVARRGADAFILFADQRFIRELLALRIAPKRGTAVLMHAFGESFCQTIRQRLHQNRRIIVIIRFEAQHMLVNAVSGRNGKAADPIILRQDERSEEHTSELQSLMRNSYGVFCLKQNKKY